MMELTFKTSLKCSGCESKVKPFLDEMKQIEKWSVNLNVNPKTVTVQGENLNAQEIINTIEKAGYKAELI